MRTKQKGFSLIELLIVVAIILIIAAIAIPNLIRSKMAANEASAVASLRTYNTSIVSFSTTYGTDPAALSNLGPSTSPSSTAADLVDNLLGATTPSKSGYTFTEAGTVGTDGLNDTYSTIALPATVGTTGQRSFFSDQTGVIRYNLTGGTPSNTSNALQ